MAQGLVEKLEQTGPAVKERVVTVSSWQGRQSLFCQKEMNNQQPPQRGGAVPGPFWGGRNGSWPSRCFQLLRLFPNFKLLFY